MQDLDELKHVFLICAEFEVKKTSVSSSYKENNFKPCLTKQLLNMFKLWRERGLTFETCSGISMMVQNTLCNKATLYHEFRCPP